MEYPIRRKLDRWVPYNWYKDIVSKGIFVVIYKILINHYTCNVKDSHSNYCWIWFYVCMFLFFSRYQIIIYNIWWEREESSTAYKIICGGLTILLCDHLITIELCYYSPNKYHKLLHKPKWILTNHCPVHACFHFTSNGMITNFKCIELWMHNSWDALYF